MSLLRIELSAKAYENSKDKTLRVQKIVFLHLPSEGLTPGVVSSGTGPSQKDRLDT